MATTVGQHSVATFSSPVNGATPIDANTVRGNDNTIRSSYNDHDADTGIHLQSSTFASRPVAGTAGRKWLTINSGRYQIWYDDGTRWHEVASDAINVDCLSDTALVKGDVVKITGFNNGQNLPTVAKVSSVSDVAFGVVEFAVGSSEIVQIVNTGVIEDVDTNGYAVGTILYPDTSGAWTTTKPTSGNYQPAGLVLRGNATNGVLYLEFSSPRIVERSDNTASTIVLRDGSGAFTTGAITSEGLITFASLKGTGSTTVTNVLDEDNMASNSATALATQQSIKAYVDTKVTAEDLDFAGDSGSGSVDLDSQTFTIAGTSNEVETSGSGQTLTVGLPSNVTIGNNLTVTNDLDVDGTTNLDAVDIDGAVQIDSTVTVGVDDTGYDVKFFGATSGAYMLWDESADDLVLAGAAKLGVGTTSPEELLDVASTSTDKGIQVSCYSTTQGSAGTIRLAHSLSGTIGSHTAVTVNDQLGRIFFAGSDGTDFYSGAAIIADSTQNFTASNGGTRLEFWTTPTNTQSIARAMTIEQDGSVGIGIASPEALLHVYSGTDIPMSSTGDGQIKIGGNAYKGAIALDGSNMNIYHNSSARGLVLGTNETARLTIAGGGDVTIAEDLFCSSNVGIGTTTPGTMLELKESSTAAGDDVIRLRGNGNNADNTVLGALEWYNADSSGAGVVARVEAVSGNPNGHMGELVFKTNDGSSTSEAMRIDKGGDVGIGTSTPSEKLDVVGNLTVSGSVSKGSGSFKIDHPLPAMSETHHLVHSFVEGPKADLIYRGSVALVDGAATVDLDAAATMTSGTWEVLCRDPQVWVQNEEGWTQVRGSISGATLSIEAQDADCTDTVSWLVVAERKDPNIVGANWTDAEGRVIVEPLKTVEE